MKDRTNARRSVSSLFDPAIILPAIGDSFRKLHPRTLIRNPVMFVVEIVTVLTTILFLRDLITGGENLKFTFQIIVWLWITLLFANFAEAVAEGRGKAQAATLRKARTDTRAKRLIDPNGTSGLTNVVEGVSATELEPGDVVLVEPGDLIPSDGDVIEGVASVNELAITGEFRACYSRGRRRSFGCHRRHDRSFRLDQGSHHRGAGIDVPRPDDRPC